jgi:DNA-binding transcriptional regulator GbsR (MarR family)
MKTEPKYEAEMPSWEAGVVELFVRGANLVGLPRSVGEIYGSLFCAENPLTFDGLVARLQISRGSVSQGLKVLRQLGAVKVHYIAGSRKDHYIAELSMQQLVQGFVRDQLGPHLESGSARLQEVEALIDSEVDPKKRIHAEQRFRTLLSWQQSGQKILPLVMAVLGGRKFFSKESDNPDSVI